MRRLFTVEDARQRGLTSAALRWGERKGQWRRIARGVWGDGPEDPSAMDQALAVLLATGGVACGRLAGVLHGLDGVEMAEGDIAIAPGRSGRRTGVRRRRPPLHGRRTASSRPSRSSSHAPSKGSRHPCASTKCATPTDGSSPRVDLAWPELGLFLELDGQHHANQPLYDARRETAVVAATGWLCGRFTWSEVVHHPRATAARLEALVAQCRRRPLAG